MKNNYQDHKETEEIIYTCPMHPEVIKNIPGSCPKCGMRLVKTEAKTRNSDHAGHVMGDP